jgi:pimeloyl-ACP methyl ester carboxylesterase
MDTLDVHLGARRPLGYNYWPLPEDAPAVDLDRVSIRTVAPDGGLARGLLWSLPGRKPRTAVIMTHPRGDFSVHYAAPLLAAAGFAVCGFGTRYMNNDTDCIHESAALDVKMIAEEMRSRGAEKVILLGNGGGASLLALAQAKYGIADGFVGLAAHPGEGATIGNVIDPSVGDEGDPFSTVAELDMYNPDNGWRPWPEASRYDREWLKVYRAAQLDRVARLDAVARASIELAERARGDAAEVDRRVHPADWRRYRARAVWTKYMVIYRTCADPVYLDLTIDPDDRPMGCVFAYPDPLDSNYRRNGLARTMTARGWLSTWSALSSTARLTDTMPLIDVPTLFLHATADTEVRLSEIQQIYACTAATDKTLTQLKGVPHAMEGHRREVVSMVADWLAQRFGSAA